MYTYIFIYIYIYIYRYKYMYICKSTIHNATFSVRTLNRISQQPELTPSTVCHNIDTVCVQEY